MCNFLGSVSSQQKFEATDVKALNVSQLSDRPCLSSWIDQCYSSDRSVLQLCVTAQFYLENKGKYILEVWAYADLKDVKGREREHARGRETPGPLAPLFICLFLPLGLPYVNWASQECCLLYLRPSFRSSDLPLFYFPGLFSSLSFSHRRSGLLFPILTT